MFCIYPPTLYTSIFSCSISDNSDVHSEKSPLLTEQQKTYESEGGSGNEKAAEEGKTREKRKKTEKDFQTIRVPGTGTAVRICSISI